MPRIVSGADIASANVRPANRYVDGRSIENLAAVAALQPVEADVLRRVDGIMDNRPANDRPEIDELIRMEQPAYKATLFPAEKAVQPGLWSLLEWRTTPAAQPVVAMPALADSIRDLSTSPAALDYSLQVRITTLPAALQTTARRIQLTINGDGRASTISIADAQAAIAAPGPFTPQDLADCAAVVLEIQRRVRLQQAALSAIVQVPTPGDVTVELARAADVVVRANSSTVIEESRSISPDEYSSSWRVSIEARTTRAMEITVPAGSQAILLSVDGQQEHVIAEGTHQLAIDPGAWRVERWKDGRRVKVGEITVPELRDERADLSRFTGHSFVDDAGHALAKNVVDASYRPPQAYSKQSHWVRYRYEANAAPPPANLDANTVARAISENATAHITLAPGRYQVTANVALDVYPGDVLKATINGAVQTLVPQQLDHKKKFDSSQGATRAWFDPTTNHLYVGDGRPSVDVTVTDAMRVA